MKKFLRNRGLVEKEVLLESGRFQIVYQFSSEKHVFITVGILFMSFFVC